jgi:hypothetical protein
MQNIRYVERLSFAVANANVFVITRMQNKQRRVLADCLTPRLFKKIEVRAGSGHNNI